MEDQAKILIGIFSGLMGIGVVIGLSILGLRKREKNRRNEKDRKDKEDARWYKCQKENTLFKGKLLEANEQLDVIWVTVGEISTTVNRLVSKDAERDELGEKEIEEAEEAKRLHFEALKKKILEINAEKTAGMEEHLDRNDKRIDKLNEDLELWDKNVTQANKDFQFVGNAFKLLSQMNKEDRENENDPDIINDPQVKKAITLAQLEELRELRGELVGDGNDNELNNPSNVLNQNTNQPKTSQQSIG